MTKIEWVRSSDGSQGQTWNPFAGCAVLSPGCTNCYAMKMAARLDAMGQPLYKGLTKPSKAGPVWRGTVRANPDALLAPLKRKKPTTYFVNSMSDLFYEKFDDEMIDQVFAVMALTPQHTYQVLTKRAERMREYCNSRNAVIRIYNIVCDLVTDGDARGVLIAPGVEPAIAPPGPRIFLDTWPLPNCWLGVSTERQKEWDERTEHLRNTPAAVRFVSAEPLLGPIVGKPETMLDLDWIIVGGESGPNARPSHPDWFRGLRDQCATAGVHFFFKQHGEWLSCTDDDGQISYGGHKVHYWGGPEVGGDGACYRVGKKAAGRLLDAQLHSAMPGRE